jgi:hypothetical protein
MSVRCAALVLLVALPLPAQERKPARPLDFDTPHWIVSSPLPLVPAKDFQAMLEGYYSLWQRKLGDGAARKLKLRLYYSRDEFNALPGRTGGYAAKDDGLHLLVDQAYSQSVAAGGARLYALAAYPGLEKRTDLPPWILAGPTAYLSAGLWREGHVEMDSIKNPQTVQSVLSLQAAMKSGDWGTFEKGFKAEGGDYDKRRRVVELQAWAVFYYLFNAPAEDGGKSPQGAAVAAMLVALNEGKKIDEALLPILKPLPNPTFAALERAVKDYFGKIKIEVKDREDGDWHIGETSHYTIYVQKGSTNSRTKQTDKQILDELKWKMELLFEKYSLAFRFQGMLSRKAVLRLHRNRSAYFTGGGPPGSAAYYSPATKELVGYEDSDETGMYWNTLCHEGCHQFFDLAFPGFYESKEIPMWFSEGLADCFGACEIRGRELYVFTLGGTATWRVEAVKMFAQAGQVSSIKDLLEMTQAPFMQRAQVHYPQSWSFVHFLWSYPNLDSRGQYYEIVVRLIDGFKVGKPRAEVYKEAFQVKGRPVDLDQLEREWKAYVKTLKIRK